MVDIGDVHVVGGRRHIFILPASENVQSDNFDLGVTMLVSLGSNVNDLAGTALDDNMTVLMQR